jgi:hypothetical protein
MNRIEQLYEEVICPMCYRLNPQHKTMDYGKGCHSCEEREDWCKSESTIPDDLMLTDEEQFNLGFKTAYKAETPELLAYEEGVMDGSESQYNKFQPIIEENKQIKETYQKLSQYSIELSNQIGQLEADNKRLKEENKEFEKVITNVEFVLDKYNGFLGDKNILCLYCGSRVYDQSGIVHEPECIIVQLRQSLKDKEESNED